MLAAHKAGVTTEGRPITTPESRELAAVMDSMDQAVRSRPATSDDPVKDLMDLMKVREEIARAGEVLRSYDPTFASTRPELGEMQPSTLLAGAHEQPIGIGAEGRVTQPLARDLPGIGLEKYQLTPQELGALKTKPPELAAELSGSSTATSARTSSDPDSVASCSRA